MRIDPDVVRDTLAALVRIDSVNPALGGVRGEAAVAAEIARRLTLLGAECSFREPEPGRVSVIGRIRGTGGGRSLMLYGHHDTVATGAMVDPFGARVEGGRLYGRGAYDMKCGLAAAIAAVEALRREGVRLAGDLVVVGVADEEVASIGIQDVLTVVRTDGAIVTEPSELAVAVAHKGFVWLRVTVTGRAAHGSRYDEGIDANLRMGRILGGLEQLERELRARPAHPLLGTPSLHAAVLRGGSGLSTYAAESVLEIERRTVPGETDAQVLGEIEAILAALRARDGSLQARVELLLSRPPLADRGGSPIVSVVERAAAEVLGRPADVVGKWYWMDAAFIAAAGIDTVCFGPAGEGAHADVEWVDLGSVEATALLLARAAVAYCGQGT